MNDEEKKILTETHLMCTEMYKVLKGNGRPGLESRVVTIEADLKNHTKPRHCLLYTSQSPRDS